MDNRILLFAGGGAATKDMADEAVAIVRTTNRTFAAGYSLWRNGVTALARRGLVYRNKFSIL